MDFCKIKSRGNPGFLFAHCFFRGAFVILGSKTKKRYSKFLQKKRQSESDRSAFCFMALYFSALAFYPLYPAYHQP
jgi:hypothetical protein